MKSNNICSKTLDKILKKAKECSGDGSYGTYYKYSQYRGIKILHPNFEDYESALTSDYFNDATTEADYLNIARKRELPVPKCYGVKIVLINGYYRIGILLQHLGDVTLNAFRNMESNKNDTKGNSVGLVAKFENLFISNGLTHRDIHHGNIMYFRKKWWVIDFSPYYLSNDW